MHNTCACTALPGDMRTLTQMHVSVGHTLIRTCVCTQEQACSNAHEVVFSAHDDRDAHDRHACVQTCTLTCAYVPRRLPLPRKATLAGHPAPPLCTPPPPLQASPKPRPAPGALPGEDSEGVSPGPGRGQGGGRCRSSGVPGGEAEGRFHSSRPSTGREGICLAPGRAATRPAPPACPCPQGLGRLPGDSGACTSHHLAGLGPAPAAAPWPGREPREQDPQVPRHSAHPRLLTWSVCHRINIYWIFPAWPRPVSAISVRMCVWGGECVCECTSV